MVAWTPVLSSVGSAVGGLLSGGHSRRERERAQRYNDGLIARQRDWFLADRGHDEEYNAERLAGDRRYARGLLVDERDYVARVKRGDRAYDRVQLAGDRRYAEGRLADDRAYMARMRDADISQYSRDRDLMQRRSNSLAERTAASRGIDFTKLRDDAVAAGYNPMTALSMAHAYSKQVDYSLQGGVYSPGASYTAAGPGYNVMGGGGGSSGGASAGGGVAPMSTPSASVAAGGFNIGGSGYQSRGAPDLVSAGSFIGEAMGRSADSYFNTPPASDPLADQLRNIEDSYNVSLSAQQAQVPKGFGYDLTKIKPFSPALSVRVPPIRDQQKQLAPPAPVAESPSDGSVTPSKNPIKVFGKDFKPQSGSSDASAAEDRYGEIGGEIVGLSAMASDGISAAYDWVDDKRVAYAKSKGKRAYKVNGKWYIQQDSVPISRKARDYATTGRTGSVMMRNPKPKAGWMDQAYR